MALMGFEPQSPRWEAGGNTTTPKGTLLDEEMHIDELIHEIR